MAQKARMGHRKTQEAYYLCHPICPVQRSLEPERIASEEISLHGARRAGEPQDSQQWTFAAFAPGASHRFHQCCLRWQTCLKLPQHLLSVTGAVAGVGPALRSPSPFCVLLSGMWTAQHFTTYRKGTRADTALDSTPSGLWPVMPKKSC